MVLSKMSCCSKSGIHKYAPHSHIHVQIIHRVVLFLVRRFFPDDREDCFRVMNCGRRHVEILWPCCPFSFWTSPVVWFTWCKGFPRSCSISKRSPSFRFGKIHIPWLLFCSINPPRCASSCSRAWELDAASDFEFLLILLSNFLRSHECHRTLGCNRTFCGCGTCRNMWRLDHRCRFRFRHTYFFSFLFLHPLRQRCRAACQAGILSAASRAEMADAEPLKKIVSFVTCELTFGRNVCELMFGINVSNLNLRIKIKPVTQPIQSNSVVSWHMSRCGTSTLY